MSGPDPAVSVPSVALATGLDGRWSVSGAIAFVALVMGTTMVAAAAAHALLGSMDDPGKAKSNFVIVQLCSQLLQLVLIFGLVGLWHRNRAAALNLEPVQLGVGGWIGVVVLLFAVKVIATMVASGLAPSNLAKDLQPFVDIVRSPVAWLLFLATVVLAGLTEELLFRGVLSRTIEASRLGFWGGAAVTSGAFAALHMQYGAGGQLVIFAIGMTLAWIRANSGSVWPAIVCHALNNALALVAMKAVG